jgi:hypothetical protein
MTGAGATMTIILTGIGGDHHFADHRGIAHIIRPVILELGAAIHDALDVPELASSRQIREKPTTHMTLPET